MRERFARYVADHLPRQIVYFAAIRLMAHATTGKWSNQIVPELLAIDALERWEK